MSEEKKEVQECKCFCKSEGFRKFLITSLGTFVGVFLALSLFAALNKPCPPCPYFGFNQPVPMQGHFRHHGNFHKMNKKFHKEFKGDMEKANMPKTQDNDD